MLKFFTNKLYLSVVGIIAVFVVAVAYIFASVLDQPLTSRPVTVDVNLAQTGGLFEGSSVTYRGVRVGKVTQIVPTSDGVRATVKITSGTDIPSGSLAKVRSLSPVGEQYLDFEPKSAKGPFLENGDTIGAGSTDLPKSLSSTVIAINKVLSQIDDKKLRIVLTELSTGLAGTGQDIGQVLDQGSQLLETLDQVWPETNRLVDNADPVLSIVSDNVSSFRSLATSANQFATFLKNYDPEFRKVLERTPGQFDQLVKLINDAQDVLPGFLDTGVTFTDLFNAYNPHLRALLRAYSPGLRSVLNKISGGKLNLDILADKDSRCDYSQTTHYGPLDERRPLPLNGACAASFVNLQRGAAHAPGRVG